MNRRNSYMLPALIVLLCIAGFGHILAQGKVTTAQAGTGMQYGIDGGKVVSRATPNAKWISVTAKLPFDVDDDAPVLVLPHRFSHKSGADVQSNAPDANILVSVPGGICSSTDGGTRWIRSLTTSGRYKAQQFRVQTGTKGTQSIYLDVQRDGETATHSWLSRNGGMSWYKASENSGSSSGIAKRKANEPRKVQELPFDIVWSVPQEISDPLTESHNAQIAISGEDTVHLAWYGPLKLPYRRSIDGGFNFSATREIFPGDTNADGMHFITNNNHVCIFFSNGLNVAVQQSDMHMLESFDYGETWSSRGRINPVPAGSATSFTSKGDTIAILYPELSELPGDYGWRLLVSQNAGITWTRKSTPIDGVSIINMSSSGTIHMATQAGYFLNTLASEIAYTESHDLGTSWRDTVVLSTNDGWFSDVPYISSFEPRPGITQSWCVWRDVKYGGLPGTLIGASLLGKMQLPGNKWTDEKIYTLPDYPIGTEACLASNSAVRVMSCLLDFGDQWHCGITFCANGITQFSPMEDITPGVEVTSRPTVVVSPKGTIHVIWEQADRANDTYHIWYRNGKIVPHAASGPISIPGTVALDSTLINVPSRSAFTVSYPGSDTLLIGSVVSDNPRFSVSPNEGAIIPSQTLTPDGFPSASFSVSHVASRALTDTATVYIYHNGPSSPDILTLYGKTVWRTVSASYEPNVWSLISVPLSEAVPSVFPNLFQFTGNGYKQSGSLVPTRGYWAKLHDAIHIFEGTPYSELQLSRYDTIEVQKGWNIIGIAQVDSVSLSRLACIPENNQASQFFGYDGEHYFSASVLMPGHAYFMKAKSPGVVVVKP